MSVAVILYPVSSTPFNMEYYISHHLPLCQRTWAKYGFKSWTACEVNDGKYAAKSVIVWDTPDGMATAVEKESEVTMNDIKNYTDVQPEVIIGKITGSG